MARYNQQTWYNASTGGTAINASRLNVMENGIANAYSSIYANVLDYGADPSGVADSSGAINSALASGQGCYIPPGNYSALSSLNIPAKLNHLIIDGAITSSAVDQVFQLVIPNNALIIEGGGSLTTGSNSIPCFNAASIGTECFITIRGLAFFSGTCVKLTGTGNVMITGCEANSCGPMVDMSGGGCSQITITDNTTVGGSGIDFNLYQTSEVVCSNNISDSSTTGGFNLDGISFGTITGNVVKGSGGYGYSVGSSSATDFVLCNNISFDTTSASFTGSLAANAPVAIVGNVGDMAGGITVSGSTVKANNINA